MHSQGVFHRDIKTDNLRVLNGTVKFIDFGISKFFIGKDTHQHTKNVVTRCYRSPEIFFGQRDYDLAAVDVWSTGCVLAELITGTVLFPGTSDIEQLSMIFEILGTPSVEEWPEVESLPCYLPFCVQPAKDLHQTIVDRRIANYSDSAVNKKMVEAIKMMLQLNPKKRISAISALEMIR